MKPTPEEIAKSATEREILQCKTLPMKRSGNGLQKCLGLKKNDTWGAMIPFGVKNLQSA